MKRYVAGHALVCLSPGSWLVEGTPYAVVASDRARIDGTGQLKGQFWWEAVDTSRENLIVEGTCAPTLKRSALELLKGIS